MKKFLKLIVNTIRAYKLSFSFGTGITLSVAFFYIATALLPIYQSKMLGDIINRIADSSSSRVVLLLIVGYCVVIAVSRFSSELRQYYEKIWTRHFEHKLETLALKKRAEIDIAKYEEPEFQNLLHRAFDNGIWPVYRLVYYQFRSTASLLTIILASAISSAIDWRIYVIALASSLPIFFIRIKYGEIMWGIWSENSARQRVYGHLRDQLRNRAAIYQNRNLQASEVTINFADKIYSDFNKEQKGVDKNRLKWSIVATTIASIGYGIAIYMVALQVLDGRLSTGAFIFLVSVLTSLIGAVDDFLENTSEQLEQNNYAGDLLAFFDTNTTIKDMTKKARGSSRMFHSSLSQRRMLPW
jgi:ATP-binding cassette, subfamily B, bacterial